MFINIVSNNFINIVIIITIKVGVSNFTFILAKS